MRLIGHLHACGCAFATHCCQSMRVWVYGCMGVWVYGCMGLWVRACARVWVGVCVRARMYGCVHAACVRACVRVRACSTHGCLGVDEQNDDGGERQDHVGRPTQLLLQALTLQISDTRHSCPRAQ